MRGGFSDSRDFSIWVFIRKRRICSWQELIVSLLREILLGVDLGIEVGVWVSSFGFVLLCFQLSSFWLGDLVVYLI